MNDPIPFSSIEIQSSDNGEPLVVLEMKMEGHCRVSISHTESYAIAFAIYNPK
jgi:phosphopantetheinyl transferase (holo-ACP synthase)